MVSEDIEFEIVVQVLNVVGYEFLNDNILLRFTLDGHRLETEKIFAKTDKVVINTKLAWTTTKGDIKRMKAENLPIRVECFRVRGERKLEPIGYVLIPLRIIPTFLYKNDLLPTPRWYKFMGVPGDVLCNRPELHLNVIIQPANECLDSIHLRGQIEVEEEDDSFIEPDMKNHFELKLDVEAEEATEEAVTPVIEDVVEKVDATKVKADAPHLLIENDHNETANYVKKLEDWKNEEKDNFLAHLKKVENSFLESMFEEWQRKKHEEENKLKMTIEECERLSKKLESGYAQMKEFNRAERDSKIVLEEKKALHEELEKEKTRNYELELELRDEREENKQLRLRIRELQKDQNAMGDVLQEMKQLRDSLTKMKLSKDYYKQKWVQLIREVNKLDPCDDES